MITTSRTINKVWAILTIMLLSSLAFAQQSPVNGTYRLQPEDVISIQIYRVAEVNAQLPIGPDGNVSAPFIGTLKAAGKTTTELENELARLYSEKLRLNDPIVSVTIVRFRAVRASINGFVGRPGTYELRVGDRILDLIAAGGGTSTDGRADLRRSYLIRKGSQERIPIDLNALILRNDSSQNYEVGDGDQLIIPEERNSQIIVAGRVQQPGRVAYREEMRLSEVVTQAGEISNRSRFSRIQVFRRLPGRENTVLAIEANLVAFHTGKDPSQDIVLQPGDFVYVPDSGNLDFGTINSIASLFFIFDRFGFNPFGIGGN